MRRASRLGLLCLLACSTSSLAEPHIELASADAEVWALRVAVRGALSGSAELASCTIERGALPFAARVERASFAAEVELEPGLNTLQARCRTRGGRELRSQVVRYDVRLHAEPVARVQMRAVGASWLKRSVCYGVLPPLFGERGLSDVSAALDELAELGVNLLWMSPLFAAPGGDFGYAVVDYFRVRSDYGSAEELHQLLEHAHRRGMRVVLDLPANHTSREHRYFQQAQALGRRSHYYDFYVRDAAGRPTHYFDWEHLPNLNYGTPEVARFMLEVARYWVVELGVDGYRVDAAWGVRQRNPEFWPRMRAALAAVDPDVLLLAEASARDSYYFNHGFDLAYDWTAELGHPAWEHVFDAASGIAKRLNAAVLATAERARVLRFLNNNDTGKRFVTRYGIELTRVATAALLTLPGVPCLYSRDEIGAEFEPYRALPRPLPAHPELRELHRRLISARRSRPALASADFEVLHAGESDEIYAYLRGRAPDVLLVVLNFSAQAAQLRLQLPPAVWPGAAVYDADSGKRIELAGASLQLAVPAWGVAIYEPR